MTTIIQENRISLLNDKPVRSGSFVLYWMQQAQRIEYNHALNYAIEEANRLTLPIVICFVLTTYPEATIRHYQFMIEGLKELSVDCHKKGLFFQVYSGCPVEVVPKITQNASSLITDKGYLRIQREWRKSISEKIDCRMVEVETDAIIPVESVSDHQEYAARTIRAKIHQVLHEYLITAKMPNLLNKKVEPIPSVMQAIDLANADELINHIGISNYPGVVDIFGGESKANQQLRQFIDNKLFSYSENRNEPSLNGSSGLSPYLHFGQISPLKIAVEVLASQVSEDEKAVFLEELIVRRELSLNFCWYNLEYDSFESLPPWAQKTLTEHAGDHRQYTYSYEELESADTHDPYWNAAQQEMMERGIMHNYMRMYWGKKILEWIPDPFNAYEFALYLNNKYALDGRDPNSYAGVAWCFGKHDRPWATRPVFGTVRTMTASGLDRKFDMQAYIQRVMKKFSF